MVCQSTAPGCDAIGTYASDYFESQVGWSAGPIQPNGAPAWHVLSDPATCDGDGDGSSDGPGGAGAPGSACPASSAAGTERIRLTDPNNPNTDGDLDDFGAPWYDLADPAPLSVNPVKGPVSGSWGPGSLLGNGGSPGPRERRGDRRAALRALRWDGVRPAVQERPGGVGLGVLQGDVDDGRGMVAGPRRAAGGSLGNFKITAARPGSGTRASPRRCSSPTRRRGRA